MRYVIGAVALTLLLMSTPAKAQDAPCTDTVVQADRPDRAVGQPKPDAPAWREVARWSGTGDKVTEPFTVTGKMWRIIYTVKDTKGSNPQLCMSVHRPDVTRGVSHGCYRQDDTLYLYAGPGTYYLDINSMDAWSVAIEDNS